MYPRIFLKFFCHEFLEFKNFMPTKRIFKNGVASDGMSFSSFSVTRLVADPLTEGR